MIMTPSPREAKEKAMEGHSGWNQTPPCLFRTQVIVQQQQKIYENTLNEAFYFPLKKRGKQK